MTYGRVAISAVIIARNEEGTIRRCIKSVFAQTVPVDEVIVVDGASTDHTLRYAADLMRSREDMVLTIQDPSAPQYGPAAARNTGAELARGDYLLFVNGDVTLGQDYVEKLMTMMEAEDLDAVTGLPWNVRSTLLSGLENVGHLIGQVDSEIPLTSDALLMKSGAFWEVGGYDPAVPSNEDRELELRFWATGIKFGRCVEATIWHEGKNHRSFANWTSHNAWLARGAAIVETVYYGRAQQSNKYPLYRNVLVPLTVALTALFTVIVLVSTLGALGWALGAAGFTAASALYLRSALSVQKTCYRSRVPTSPLPLDVLLYPAFSAFRSALLAIFMWQSMRSITEVADEAGQAEDRAA